MMRSLSENKTVGEQTALPSPKTETFRSALQRVAVQICFNLVHQDRIKKQSDLKRTFDKLNPVSRKSLHTRRSKKSSLIKVKAQNLSQLAIVTAAVILTKVLRKTVREQKATKQSPALIKENQKHVTVTMTNSRKFAGHLVPSKKMKNNKLLRRCQNK